MSPRPSPSVRRDARARGVPRIVFTLPTPQARTGGNRETCRHAEALTRLGYDAVVRLPPDQSPPDWFSHGAPFDFWTQTPDPDEILVISEDATRVLAACAALPNLKVVHCKNPYYAAAAALAGLAPHQLGAYRHFIACSDGVAAWIARYFDHDVVASIPNWIDGGVFRPREKAKVIACMPRKRKMEAAAIRGMFQRLSPFDGWAWDLIEGRSEAETAEALGRSAVYLSLARFEGMCASILEGMSSGCLVAGFTGVGAREYATTLNGLWVEEDDCEAAARALVRAVAIAEAGDAEAELMREAARRTAAAWNEELFQAKLVEFWRDRLGLTP